MPQQTFKIMIISHGNRIQSIELQEWWNGASRLHPASYNPHIPQKSRTASRIGTASYESRPHPACPYPARPYPAQKFRNPQDIRSRIPHLASIPQTFRPLIRSASMTHYHSQDYEEYGLEASSDHWAYWISGLHILGSLPCYHTMKSIIFGNTERGVWAQSLEQYMVPY